MERLNRLVNYFARLPGIGKKSASRVAYWLLETEEGFVKELSRELNEFRNGIVRCSQCGNYAETPLCGICESLTRDRTLLCIVEHPRDVPTIESTGEYRGLYHVLHGVLSPLDGMGPEELGLNRLRNRVLEESIQEIVVATNPTLEGDSTALFVMKMFESDNVRVSRIASGVPVGGDMEYTDKLSVARAFRARVNIGNDGG